MKVGGSAKVCDSREHRDREMRHPLVLSSAQVIHLLLDQLRRPNLRILLKAGDKWNGCGRETLHIDEIKEASKRITANDFS